MPRRVTRMARKKTRGEELDDQIRDLPKDTVFEVHGDFTRYSVQQAAEKRLKADRGLILVPADRGLRIVDPDEQVERDRKAMQSFTKTARIQTIRPPIRPPSK